MFDKILIANRGEIALRILRACKELGIATVAVHSTADADAMHVRLADESVCIGPPPARDSYLNIPQIVAACEITGADAVHPGYGFLSENARFAEILAAHEHHLHRPERRAHPHDGRQDRGQAHRASGSASRWCPARDGAVDDDDEAARIAADIGYPVLIKAAAGGGGRGMKVARSAGRPAATRSPRRAPRPSAAFGDDAVYLEKYLGAAAPHRGPGASATAAATPSTSASATARCSAATRRSGRRRPRPADQRRAAQPDRRASSPRRCAELGYRGAGTIEFLYENGEFYFIEMNTRLQVEHPVTEAITGIDLVRRADPHRRRPRPVVHAGGRAASPATPSSAASTPRTRGPSRPRPGTITYYHPPGGLGVRVDSARLSGLHDPALLRQPDRQADRPRPRPRRMPDAAAPRARRVRRRRHRDHHPALPAT